jgi:hypothetical protein
MHVHRSLRLHKSLWQDAHHALKKVTAGGAMDRRDAVHRTILVADIAHSTHPIRTNDDRLVIRAAMYSALAIALGRHDSQRCRWEDRGDGVLILVPPEVPKARLVTGLHERLEAALAMHNVAMAERDGERASATQVQLRLAMHAGEVTFDQHGVVGAAIDHTFRMVDAPPLKAALAGSLDSCVLMVSEWFYSDVVFHHLDARPDAYRHVGCEVKDTELSAWLRVPEPRLTLERTALAVTGTWLPAVLWTGVYRRRRAMSSSCAFILEKEGAR